MDSITAQRRSENMRRIRSRDTNPELVLRRRLHHLGYRFRVHRNDLPGKPDLTFAGRRKVIFVHGCFWHQHHACTDGRVPKSNLAYWGPKLRANVIRDRKHIRQLKRLGWDACVVWECELKNFDELLPSLKTFLGPTAETAC